MSISDEYITMRQAAALKDVDRHTLARWIDTGRLAAERIGREVLIRKADLAAVERDPRGRKAQGR